MYAPAPPRPKKTNIVRSRSGCKCCRERRRKCDEKKPKCGTCTRLGTVCEPVKVKLEFRITTAPISGSASGSTRGTSETRIYRQRESTPSLQSGSKLIQSLQQLERDVFYSTYWDDRCLPALHPLFRSATHLIADQPVLKDAVLALSSCNLSRIAAERKDLAVAHYTGTYSPNLSHQTRSELYYSSAIHGFIKMSQRENWNNTMIVLTILVLFAHIESTRGNFEGFCCHVQGLSAFLNNRFNETSGDDFLKNLLTAWMQPQFQVWWARAYFSSLDVQIKQRRVAIPRVLKGDMNSLFERRIAILNIMIESHRLNFTTTLRYWQCRANLDDWGYEGSHANHEHEIELCCRLLAKESNKLEDWLLHLPPSEIPVASDYPDDNSALIRPLFFESHDAALNYAYYVLARIMQCIGIFDLLKARDYYYIGHECYEAEPWVKLLLRIAEGIDKMACIRQNSYTIGFSGLMLAALLRCQDLASGLRIESWLAALNDMHPTEEGSFPVYQALSVTRAINQQRMADKDVFAVSLPVDDGGGAPKFSSYNSQMIDTLLIHGRCRVSGNLFTECIIIDR